MDKQFLWETLEKQVRLLSECSEKCAENSDAQGLAALSEQLINLVDVLGLPYA